MSCRAFIGGLLVGAAIGFSGLWRSATSRTAATPRRFTGSDGRRPHSLTASRMGEAGGDAGMGEVGREALPAAPASLGMQHDSHQVTLHDHDDAPPSGSGRHWSVGKLHALPRAVDIAAPGMAAHVAHHRSYRREMIMFTSDHQMGGWAYHWVRQMRRWGYEHWMILGDQESTCETLSNGWRPMVDRYSEEPLSCVWSSYPKSHPGWNQWKPRHGADSLHNVYMLWASRWWVSWKLLEQGVSVLSLDVDAVLLSDIYALLHSPPLSHQDVLISRNSDESQSLNCGFVYFNARAAKSSPRSQPPAACPANGGNGGSVAGVPAAEWVARSMWERIELFLDVRKASLSAPPVREVLWEQDAWNDLAKTLELNTRVFPWAVGYGKESDLWPTLGYKRQVVGGMKHEEKWVSWQKLRPARQLPPWQAPEESNAGKFYDVDLRKPLLWIPLCGPRNISAGASAPIPGGVGALTTGIPFGMLTDKRPLLPGRLMVAPTWLSSLGTDPEADWADSKPRPFAYLHLTNLWHCFPHMCWSKAGRLFWLRAHRFWDKRLDALGITPRGKPYSETTRVLALPRSFFDAVAALTPPHGGELPFVKAKDRWLAYRRMHALVHNLATIAALLGRLPVIPQVPCSYVKAVQQRVLSTPSGRSRFGVSHPSVVATGTPEKPVCHLAPGTWRPGGPDQCYHNRIMSQFDYDDWTQSDAFPQAKAAAAHPPSLPLPPLPIEPPDPTATYTAASLDVDSFAKLCEAAKAHGDAPILQLDGLISEDLAVRDLMVDAPVGVSEFASEKLRLASGRPRWLSLLQPAQLKRLAASCPGAATLIAQRKACVGYFLAE